MKLPKIQGKYIKNANLSKMNWFGVGGKADVLFEPRNVSDLLYFLKNKPKNLKITILGGGSNILIKDERLRGVTIKLSQMNDIKIEKNKIIVECGCLNSEFFSFCKKNNIANFEFLGTIPGTIGGAVKMNAGCFKNQISDLITELKATDFYGNVKIFSNEEIGFVYRGNKLQKDLIFIEVTFKAKYGDAAEIEKKFDDYRNKRKLSQPTGVKTAGSVFKNPKGYKKAWQLIEEAGCRGLNVGDAYISEEHCNFMINKGKATAKDLKKLGEIVRKRVKEKTGILLEWEIQILD